MAGVSAFTILKLSLLLNKRPILPLIFLLPWALQTMQTVLNPQRGFFHSLHKTSPNSNMSHLYVASLSSGWSKLIEVVFRNEAVTRKPGGWWTRGVSKQLESEFSWKGAFLQETSSFQVTTRLLIRSQDEAKIPVTEFKP